MVNRAGALFYKIAMILLVNMVVNNFVLASDQADYSAPYITFEDGKLVTKDPTTGQVTTQSGTHSTEDTGTAETTPSEPASGTTDLAVTPQEDSVAESVSVRYIVMTSSAVILFITAFIFYKLRGRRDGNESHGV